MAEPEPEPELNVDAQAAAETGSGSEQAAVEEGDAPAASTATSAPQRPPTTAATDDASPHKLADAGPPEGKPLDKIIRTELAEEAEGESDEAQGAAAGGDAGLTLELPDGSPDEASATETDLPRVDTPSAGVIHSSLASSPGGKISSSPVQDAVGKVHAVTGDLVATPSAGGAPTLAVVADASDVECETPRGDAATDAEAKTAWPGAEADGDEDEEDEEEDGDAFGEDESGLGEMHAVGKVPVVTRRKRADTGAGGALMDAAAKVLGTGDGK